FFFSSRRRHTRSKRDWSSDVCSSDLAADFVIDRMLRPATEAAIEERVDQMLEEETAVSSPLEEMEEVVDAIPNDFIREQARSLQIGRASCRERAEMSGVGGVVKRENR